MNGVLVTPSVFNVWSQGADVYRDPLAVADAIDAAEVVGVHDLDLLVDSYQEVFSDSQMGRLYEGHLQDVIEGRSAEAVEQKGQLAKVVRKTDKGKWREVVERAGQRVRQGKGHKFLQYANSQFFAETRMIADIRSLVEQGYQPAMERLVPLASQGDEVAQEAMRTADTETLEKNGDTQWSRWCLVTLADWGNVAAVWSLTRLQEGGDKYADEMLADIDPSALARRAEAGDEEAQRAVTALAFYNHKAMHVLGDWILAGQRHYASLLRAVAVRDEATTRAIDELARVAQQNFEHLEWLFRLLESFAFNPGGDRCQRTLAHLRSFDLSRLAPAARENVLAFHWLVRLADIDHPGARQEAEAAVAPLREHLRSKKDMPALDLLFRSLPPQVAQVLGRVRSPHARAVVRL